MNEFRTIDKIDDLLTILQDYLVTYWKKDNPIIPLNTGGEPSDIMYNIGYKDLLYYNLLRQILNKTHFTKIILSTQYTWNQ